MLRKSCLVLFLLSIIRMGPIFKKIQYIIFSIVVMTISTPPLWSKEGGANTLQMCVDALLKHMPYLQPSPGLVFGNKTPYDFVTKEYSRWKRIIFYEGMGVLKNLGESLGVAHLSESAVLQLQISRSAEIAAEFLAAKQRGEVELLKKLNASESYRVAREISKMVAEDFFSFKFLDFAIHGDDELYAYDGELIRFRPGDNTVFVLPRGLQSEFSKVIPDISIYKIRKSWILNNFAAEFPQYRELFDDLAVQYSSWNAVAGGVQYHLEKEISIPVPAGSSDSIIKGIVYIHIQFKEEQTLVFMNPPQIIGKSSAYDLRVQAEVKKYLRRRSEEAVEDGKPNPFSRLSTYYFQNHVLALMPGEETVSFLVQILRDSPM